MDEEYKEYLNYFKKKLPIDQFDLAKECLQQAALYQEVGEWASFTKAEAKKAKEHVDFIRADLYLKVRKTPASYGLEEKVTEGSIGAVITTSEEYKQALTKYIELSKAADEASIFLSAVEQRKSMIRDLVRLFIYSYYSREDVVGREDWKSAEQAIIDLRNRKASENREDLEDEEMVEEE